MLVGERVITQIAGGGEWSNLGTLWATPDFMSRLSKSFHKQVHSLLHQKEHFLSVIVNVTSQTERVLFLFELDPCSDGVSTVPLTGDKGGSFVHHVRFRLGVRLETFAKVVNCIMYDYKYSICIHTAFTHMQLHLYYIFLLYIYI